MRGAMRDPRRASAVIVGALLASGGCSPLRADATTSIELFRQNAMAHAAPAPLVQDLCDRTGPRPAGSENERKAIAWALDKMKALGLQNVREEPVMVPHWVRGDEHAELLTPESQRLAITALGGSVETPEGGLEADVIEVSSLEGIEALPADDVRGKIVFVNTPMERTRNEDGYSRAVPVRGGAAVAAAKKGAAAAIIRSIATGNARFPHTGHMHYEEGVPKIPAAALSVPDAMLLDRFIKAKKSVRLRMTVGGQSLPDEPSANVVGEVIGQEKPNEVLLIGAHLDSWDLGTGALDDGAGVGMVLETGNLIAHAAERPRRTVRVVLFANEEFGLNGGRAYAEAHRAELKDHVLAIEADFGAGGAYEVSFLAGPAAVQPMAELSAPLSPLGVGPAVKGELHGSDLLPLRAAGVPMADVAQDATTYFDYHHSADDTFDKIDAPTLAQATAVLATFSYAVSRSVHDLGRAPARKPPLSH
jgi:Zn-dependent M28 family amino/carboxypeptidase